MKLTFIISFIIQLLLVNAASLNRSNENTNSSDYLITVPKVLTNDQDKICLTWLNEQNRPTSGKFNVKINEIGSETLIEQVSAQFSSETACVEIPTKKIRSPRAELEITLGDKVHQKQEVQVRPAVNLVLIETSKPVYKPSETIEFNILTVDQQLKPVNEQFKKIWVENPYTTSIKQWRNVDSKDGVLSFRLDTAEENVLGKWTIKALTKDNHLIHKVFELTRYLTPKINIDVTKPNYLLASEKQTEVEIKVVDQFNYPINGIAKIHVGYKPSQFEQSREVISESMPSEKIEKEVKEGLAKITIDHEKLQANSPHNAQRLLVLSIEVEQEKTNLTQTLIQELPISPRRILVTLPSTRMGKQYFKANLPFKSYFTIERPDLTEAEYQKVTVCVEQRQKPWISEKENQHCKEFTSDKDGIVKYETQPLKKSTQQLFITVQPLSDKQTEEEKEAESKSFVVHPWFDDSETNFIITPTVRREKCLKKHNVEIIFYNLNKKTTAFYQVVGRKIEAPVKFTVDPTKMQKIEGNLLKMNLAIESELLSSVSQPVARLVIFMRDTNKTLVADYDTFEVNCEDRQAEIQINTRKQTSKNYYEFDVNVNTQPDAKCILQISQQEARHDLMQKRIARLMEKMDLNLDLINRDKCEKELYVRHARNGLRNVIPQESIINYKSSWDVFNKVGLEAISDMDLDKAPCEMEMYPEGFSKEMSEEFEKVKFNLLVQRNYYINDLSELTKLEQNTTEDLIQWINLEKGQNKNQKVIVRNDQINEEVHFNTICVSSKAGIQFGHKKLASNAVQPFEVDIVAPEQMIAQEVVRVYVDLHKQNPNSVPVVIEPVSNSHFEIVLESGEHNKFNFEGEHHRVVYRVKALSPVAHTTLQFVVHDNQNGQQYPTKVHTHDMSIVNYGSIVRNTEYQILMNENNSPKKIQLVNTNGKDKQQVKNLTVSTDILDILVPNRKDGKQHHGEQNNEQPRYRHASRDGLSLQYKSPVELVSYLTILAESERNAQSEQQKKDLINEMERVYQQLETKRLPDGSYSTFIGKSAASPFADLALTSTIFKLYVQLQHNEQLPQISHASLKRTFIFLNSLQSEQGSFPSPIQQSKAFPMSLTHPLDVTAYVAMQLAESKSDFDSPIMKKSLRYIIQELKNNSTENKEHEFANAAIAYLYALKGINEKSEKWSAKVDSKDLNQLAKRQHGEQIIAIQTLTAVKLNKKSEVERLAKWLFTKQQEISQDQLFSSPIMSQAIVRAWNAMNGNQQTVKVNGKQVGRNQVRLGDNVDKVTIENRGFLIAVYKKEQNRQSENQKEFKITVNGLNRGFRSCAQRSINVCYKTKGQQVAHNPVINVQLPTGYQVDEYLLSNMLTYGSANQLDSFDIRQQNLHLLLKPAQDSQSHCVEIPIVQVQKVQQRKKNFVQMVNYYDYQQQLSRKEVAQYDTIFYELPKECEVIDRPLFTLGQKLRPQPMNFSLREQKDQIFENHHGPLEIMNCPEGVEDSCPTCLDELNKSYEEQVCKTQFVSAVHRRDLKTNERELFNQTKSNTRCIVLPMKLEQIVLNKEQKLQNNDDVLVYVNEKCRCGYINERQGHGKAILVKNDIEKLNKKQALQLTKEDILVVYAQAQSNEMPSCMKELSNLHQSRPKREVEGDKKDNESSDSKDENKNKRSGTYGSPSYQQSSYAQAPPSYSAPSYSAPAPSYSAPSYSAPSYSAPSYSAPAPSYSAPSYSAPAPSYSAPAPSYSVPAPSYSAPSYSVPAPSYSAPSYSVPAPSYSAPSYSAPSYSVPTPSYSAPSYSAQSYSAPSYSAPSYSATSYSAPSYETPSYSAPSYSAPSYSVPAPSYSAPSYSAPSYSAPSYSAPSYSAPSYSAPSYSAPSYSAPSYSAPSYSAPSYSAPSYSAPSYSTPSYEMPAYQAPSYSSYEMPSYAPTYTPVSYEVTSYQMYEEPKQYYQSYSAPAYSPPTYEMPSYAPTYSAPAPHSQSYSAPSYSVPAPSYSAPSYSAPSYSAPSYSAPSYSMPSYSAPSYSAPSYSAPSYSAPSYSMPSYSAPSYSAPSYSMPSYSAPSYNSYKRSSGYGYSAPSYSAPSYSAPAPSYSAPSYSAPAPSYSAPSYSAPSYSAPSYSAPAPSYSAPSYSAPSYSAPSYSTPAPYVPTQSEYSQPQYSSYSVNPGLMNSGYGQSASYGSAYSAPVAYKPASSYKRSAVFDLASSASNSYQSYSAPSYGGDSYSGSSYGGDSPSGSSYGSSYSAPAPSYGGSSYSAPAQSYGGSSYGSGGSSYGGGYSAPAPSYGGSSSGGGYGGMSSGYGSGGSSYGGGYSAPAPSYGGSSYGGGYGGMSSGYGGSSYGGGYSAPAPSYGGSSYGSGGSSYGGGYSAPSYGGSSSGGGYGGMSSGYGSGGYSAPSYGGSSYGGGSSYAVLYTPVKYATAYVPTYVSSSYGGSGYGAVPSYGGSSYGGYASASEEKSTVLRSMKEDKCEEPAQTCPVCEDSVNLEILNNICNLDLIATVYKANQTRSSNNNKAVCGKINIIENIIKRQDNESDNEYRFTIQQDCTCPQLRNVGNMHSNAIVLASRKNVNDKVVRLDENTYVLSDHPAIRDELYNTARDCRQSKTESFLEDF